MLPSQFCVGAFGWTTVVCGVHAWYGLAGEPDKTIWVPMIIIALYLYSSLVECEDEFNTDCYERQTCPFSSNFSP